MRSTTLRNILVSSLALTFSLAAGCTDPENTDPEFVDVGSGGVATTTGGIGGFDTSVSVGSGISTPPGAWTKRYGDAEDQRALALAVNEAGDVALTGSARGTIDFGNIPWTGSATDDDVFVAKLSREGQSQWSRRYGDSCDQSGSAVALAPTGDVLIAGDFCGKMDFGNTTLEAAGESDIFVALIDDIGEDIYSRRLGGAGAQTARAATVDTKGNAILVGSFEKAFDDGSGPLTSAGMDDAFVTKLDAKGQVLWSRRLGGLGADIARAVGTDVDGNVLVGGSFEGTVDFGGGPIAAAPGHSSAFVLSLDPDGKLRWARTFTGDDESVINGLAVTLAGKVAVTGSFVGAADFGSGPVSSLGAEDVFLALLDSDGATSWSFTAGGPKAQIGTGVSVAPNGILALSVTSQEEVDFGSSNVFPAEPLSQPELLYIVSLKADGTPFFTRALASAAPIASVGVGIESNMGVFLAASFQDALEYGYGGYESSGGWDVLVSHLQGY